MRRVSLALALVGAVSIAVVAAPRRLGGSGPAATCCCPTNCGRARLTCVVDGFDEQDHVKIARGSDWPLTVKADAAPGRWIPEIVEVRYTHGRRRAGPREHESAKAW